MRAGAFAGNYAREHGATKIDAGQVDEAALWALAPFERNGSEGPFQIQEDLQAMMQDLVGIVRQEAEMQRALDGLAALRERARRVRVTGNREYNPGWHTALDLHSLLTVSEAITRAALVRKESRGGHFRDDYPDKDARLGRLNYVVRKGPDDQMQLEAAAIPEMPAELQQIIEEMQ
jgi:succinate dehydrogenase / fumarate reductase flavoprotein subunit